MEVEVEVGIGGGEGEEGEMGGGRREFSRFNTSSVEISSK